MVGLCLIRADEGPAHEVDQLFYLAWAFGVTDVWVVAAEVSRSNLLHIGSLTELPATNLVLVQPANGVNVQGLSNLVTFEHPLDAIYIFGASDSAVQQSDVEGVAFHSKVFVDCLFDLHAPLAASIVMQDRKVKLG